VLVNLLDNAIKYSEPGDRITVRTEPGEGVVWTHVHDEGQGIAPEELARVFERFYRTKGALSGRARGSGLGLAIVKHIVQQLGGEIGVSSTLGEGSDFYFSLRLPPASPTPALGTPASAAG
jgi:signal transduction histidine kinase